MDSSYSDDQILIPVIREGHWAAIILMQYTVSMLFNAPRALHFTEEGHYLEPKLLSRSRCRNTSNEQVQVLYWT